MKRRGFFKIAAAALLAPLALVKTTAATPKPDLMPVAPEPLGASIDWVLKYAKDPRWDIVSRAMDVMKEGFDAKQHAKMSEAFHNANRAMKEFSEAALREELCELGRRTLYHRHVEFPVEVTCEVIPSPGWDAYWENYCKCVESQGIDHEKT